MNRGNIAISQDAIRHRDSRSIWHAILLALFGLLALSIPASAQAQFSESYNFLKAVKDRDGEEASKFLNRPGTVIVNTRDRSTGETALHIVVARRDSTWLAFLLQKGANPNIRDKSGTTPLMLATQLRFVDGARLLLAKKADVNQSNNQGETALIRAVQLRDTEMVRVLLQKGADPDRVDTLAGLSARDYATRDRRAAAVLSEIEKADAKKKPASNDRFFGPEG
ncbi:Ankyrin repeat-containing protein [Parasphingorhabdus marina DSM 22363]|uniref:Ankyrin repeat-containing protein n=2 Tax=Parasphingorhabdus marina TaxID=394732 RepID=A0A1N6CP69_9SPHN|nr:Ankyrin repeat-containing protein [Parasphingorhabdus marina DSM 22363]